jgi:hypothetical protein
MKKKHQIKAVFNIPGKWESDDKDSSEVLIEPLKISFSLKRFIPGTSDFFRKRLKPSIYFETTKLNIINFGIFPSKTATPNNFKLVIDEIKYPDYPNISITSGSESNIVFDENHSSTVSPKSIKFHFPKPGLVTIKYRILDENGGRPKDKNGKEIIVVQRNFSEGTGRAHPSPQKCNEGDMPIIILDYHTIILIRLTWVLIALTGILALKEFL